MKTDHQEGNQEGSQEGPANDRRPTRPSFRRPVQTKANPWPFVGMVGMACALFIYAFSGLLAPWWFVCFLLLIWLVLFVLGIRWFAPHPVRVAWLPVVAIVLWFGLVNLGAAVFHFTA